MSTVAIIGLGTIGSVVAPLVARIPDLAEIILVDPDEYSHANLQTQAIQRSAIGKMKVDVQAAALQAINPALSIKSIAQPVENVPLATFRNCILLSCVDNRRARQTINRVAWRCDSTWIDAAVGAESVARLGAYHPNEGAACLECGWDQSSYDLLEQEYPCVAGEESAPASDTVAELGALAACLQVGELRKHLRDGCTNNVLVGGQFMLDTSTYMPHLLRVQHNPQCRFDHQTWKIESTGISPAVHTLENVFDLVGAKSDSILHVDSHYFATYLDCLNCGRRCGVGLSIHARFSAEERTCSCGGRMMATGFFSFDRLRRSELSSALLQRTLETTGLQPLDVLSLEDSSGRMRHFCIGEESSHE